MNPVIRAAKLIPHAWRQRAKATGLRVAAKLRPHEVPPSATVDSGATVIADCFLCARHNTEHRVIGHVVPTHHGQFSAKDYRLLHCQACDSVYLFPPPSVQDLKVLYEDSTQFIDPTYTDAARVERILYYLGGRLGELGLFPGSGQACLEVGAGLAWISRVCKQHDGQIVTVAQDISSEAAGQCPWVDRYVVGPVESLDTTERFRLISMTHVIEHLLDPKGMLTHLAGRLSKGGHLFITAPFRPPLWKPRDGIAPWLSYSYLHVPAHISYFSKRWFEEVAEQCGLRMLVWDPSHDGHQAFEVVLHKPGD